MPPRVAVIGAGISGLAAAIELQSCGVDVVVLEKAKRAGGPIHTEHVDDLLVDAGPDSFLSTKPGGLAFADRLGVSAQLIGTRADGGGTYIVHDSQMEPLPEGITMLVPTQFRQILTSPLLDFSGKSRLLADYLIPARPGPDDESVSAFMQRRVGTQAFENLAEPLLSGIFAGDASKLSILSTFPRLRESERQYGGLIRASIANRRQSAASGITTRRHTPFVSFEGGLGTLVDAAIKRLGSERLIFDSEAVAIEPIDDGYNVVRTHADPVRVDGVVLATPASVSARLLASMSPDASALLAKIPYVSSATVSMAFSEADATIQAGGRGFVVPRREGFDLTAVTWSSRKFAGRASDGRVLMRGFVGRAGNEGPVFLSDDEIVNIVRRDLERITGISADPQFSRVYRWVDAMPQYHVGHNRLIADVEQAVMDQPHLAITGAAFHGVGIPDCIESATTAAAALVRRLENSSSLKIRDPKSTRYTTESPGTTSS